MANQPNSYQRNGHRTYTSFLPSINSPDSGHFHGHSRDMRPPIPPQPMEIADLYIKRTLPSLSATGSGNLDLLPPPSHGYPDAPYGHSNIPKLYQQLPTDGQIPRPSQDLIQDWYTNDAPWTHIPKVMPPNNTIPDGRFQSKQTSSRNYITPGGQYKTQNPSESGSFHYGVPHSDSGYGSGTRRSVASVFSGDVPERDQDCQSLTGPVEGFQPFIGSNEDVPQRDARPFDQWTPVTSTLHQSRGLVCPTCHKPVKTQSELKKHELRHNKPFHCDTPGCSRTDGFSTPNDLDRHKRSKHSELVIASEAIRRYRCLVEGCKSKEKSWPRLDNFKSHLRRVHQSSGWSHQAMTDMLKRSEYWDCAPTEELSVEKHTLPDLAQPPTTIPLQENLSSPRSGSAWMPYPKAIEPAHDLIAPKGPQAGLYETRSISAEERYSMPPASPQTIVKPRDVVRNYVPDPLPLDRISLVPAGHDNPGATKPDQAKPRAVVKPSSQSKSPRQTNMSAALVEELKHALSAQPTTTSDDPPTGDSEQSQPNGNQVSRDVSTGIDSVGSRSREGTIVTKVSTPEEPKESEESKESKESQAEKEALKLVEIIRKLGYTISKDPTHAPRQHNVGSAASLRSENQVTCQTCKKFTGRPCELKKHMKRHEKPYGCTFETCNKVFGSKNDWKRHENSQHYHNEVWRCNEFKLDQNTCACTKVCYRRITFQEHLKKDHLIRDEGVIRSKIEKCRIGRNGQSRFWCGFCNKTVELKRKGLEAWTERFDHIDDHFMGRNKMPRQSILEWVPCDSDKPKGDTTPDAGLASSNSDKEAGSPEHASSNSDSTAEKITKPASSIPTLDSNTQKERTGLKRHSPASEESSRANKKSKTSSYERFIICCECEMPHNPRLHSSCSNCVNTHRWCPNCRRDINRVVPELDPPLPNV